MDDVEIPDTEIVTAEEYRLMEAAKKKEQKVVELIASMRSLPQVHLPLTHHFAPGIYNREMFIPAGTCIVGYYHKNPTMNILLKGRLLLMSDDGGEPVEVCAPYTCVTPAGIQKTAVALEDSTFMNIWHTNETNVDQLEEDMFDLYRPGFEVLPDNPDYVLGFRKYQQLGQEEKTCLEQ